MDQDATERFGYNKGFTQGIAKGIDKGIKTNSIEIAKKMLNKKMEIALIMEITGLTEEEINKLKEI